MTTHPIDVVNLLSSADAEFGQVVLRLMADDASDAERAALRRLYAFVHADPAREAQFAVRLRRLDAGTRRKILTPERIAAVLPDAVPDLAALASPSPRDAAIASKDDASLVLWSTGKEWVRVQLGTLGNALQRGVELVSTALVKGWEASDALLALRQDPAVAPTRSVGQSSVGGEVAGGKLEVPIVGHDWHDDLAVASMRLLVGPLTFSRAQSVDAPTGWLLHGELELSAPALLPTIERGVGVLLVSDTPSLALPVTLQKKGEVMVGTLEVPLRVDQPPEALDRTRFTARVWRSLHNGKRGAR